MEKTRTHIYPSWYWRFAREIREVYSRTGVGFVILVFYLGWGFHRGEFT